MLSLKITEPIQDQENMPKGKDAGGLMAELGQRTQTLMIL